MAKLPSHFAGEVSLCCIPEYLEARKKRTDRALAVLRAEAVQERAVEKANRQDNAAARSAAAGRRTRACKFEMLLGVTSAYSM